jgi:hypothetical protein
MGIRAPIRVFYIKVKRSGRTAARRNQLHSRLLHEPLHDCLHRKEMPMISKLAVLMEKMRSVEAEVEAELAKRQEELRFRFEKRRIVFEQEAQRIHHAIKTRASRYFLQANPLIVLTAPVIYSLLIPVVVLDIFVVVYQAICFPIYKIPKVRRRDYLVFDRHHLAYLNVIEKVNCAYCSYVNGAFAFVREVGARTELYWCPIKHARRILGPHPHYQGFADFGDAEGYRKQLDTMKDGVTIDGA